MCFTLSGQSFSYKSPKWTAGNAGSGLLDFVKDVLNVFQDGVKLIKPISCKRL